MSTLPPYPAYKPSGIDWLGDMPSHWDTAQLQRVAKETKLSNRGMLETTVLSLSYGRIKVKDPDKKGLMPENFGTYQIVNPGNIILRLTDLQNDQTSLRVGLAKDRGIITSAYVCLNSTDQMESRYLYRLLHSFDEGKHLYGMGSGVRQGLSYKELRREPFPLPPLDEQRAIADFLDRKDAEITRFIESRRRMIALLEEKKQAVINQAVTRGLDPSVPMKDSGVEWLGEIPAHWEVRRLKQVAHLHRGYDLPATSRNEGGVPVISSGGIAGYHDVAMVEGPGVVMGRYGSTQNLFFTEVDFWPHNTSLYVDDFCGNHHRYVYWLLGTVNVAAFSEKSAVPGVDRKDLHEILIAYPPIQEQQAIAAYFDEMEIAMSAHKSRYLQEIGLIQEYQTRLISDVVTGKVRVG